MAAKQGMAYANKSNQLSFSMWYLADQTTPNEATIETNTTKKKTEKIEASEK